MERIEIHIEKANHFPSVDRSGDVNDHNNNPPLGWRLIEVRCSFAWACSVLQSSMDYLLDSHVNCISA